MSFISKNKSTIIVIFITIIIITITSFLLIKNRENTSLKSNYLIVSEGDFQKIDGQEAKQEKLKKILYRDNQEVINKFSQEGLVKSEDVESYELISKDFEEFNSRKNYTISYLPFRSVNIPETDLKNYKDSSDMVLFVSCFDQSESKENLYFPYNTLKNIGDKKTFTLENGKKLTMVRSDYAITEDGKYFGLYTGNKAFEEYLINQKGESTRSKLLEFDTNSNKEKFEYSWSY